LLHALTNYMHTPHYMYNTRHTPCFCWFELRFFFACILRIWHACTINVGFGPARSMCQASPTFRPTQNVCSIPQPWRPDACLHFLYAVGPHKHNALTLAAVGARAAPPAPLMNPHTSIDVTWSNLLISRLKNEKYAVGAVVSPLQYGIFSSVSHTG